MRTLTVVVSLIMLALVAILGYDLRDVKAPSYYYPGTILVMMFVLSFIIFVRDVFSKNNAQEKPFENVMISRVLSMVIGLILYGSLIKFFGFYFITFIFMVIITWILAGKESGWLPWIKYSTFSSITIIVIYIAFSIFLKVPIPMGLFFS